MIESRELGDADWGNHRRNLVLGKRQWIIMQIRQEKGNTLMGLIRGGCELGVMPRGKRHRCQEGQPHRVPVTLCHSGKEGLAISTTSAHASAWNSAHRDCESDV